MQTMAFSSTSRRQGSPDESGLTELRVETLRMLILAILGVAYVVVMSSLASITSASPPAAWDPLPSLCGLLATAGLTRLGLRIGPAASTLAMILGLTVTLTVVIFLHPGSVFATYFFLIVVAATGVFNWHAGLGAALLTSSSIALMTKTVGGLIPPGVEEQALICIWGSLFLIWLLMRSWRTTMSWAWSSYLLAEAKTEEARLRQAELAQVTKSLSEACERLERLNQELQEARKAAETARRMKAEFAATVGHELRTPINLIIGFSQMMASPRRTDYYTEPLPEVYRADIDTIHHNACHISSLVDDILDLSQIDAHRMALHKEPVTLARVAQEAVANVAPLYLEAGLSLSVDIRPDLPRVPADPVRIRQTLINLLYNSVRFTHQGGVIITAQLTSTDVIVSVQDTGVGIAPESLTRLFEEFRQIQAPSRGHVGSGLGLAVCKRFIELHGGNIWAESKVDRGTTISFSLPLRDNVTSTPFRSMPTPVTHANSHYATVAILDSSGETVRIVQRYLDGYRVRAVKHPEQVSRLAMDGGLRGVIVTCPTAQSAWHDYQRLHHEVESVPTIFYPLRTHEMVAQALHASTYLAKPVRREQLAQALRGLGRRLRHLLVVEDDAEMRALLVRMLRSINRRFVVEEASTGAEGLDAIRRVHPDAILLDLMMPNLDGYAVLQAIQEDVEVREIPVVVISAKGPREEARVDMVGVTRHNGLAVGETIAYLRASLDALHHPLQAADGPVPPDGMAQARPAGSSV